MTDTRGEGNKGAAERRPAWTSRRLAWVTAIVCVAAATGAGLSYRVAHAPALPPGQSEVQRARPAGAAERALVSPLAEGSALGGFQVKEIHAVSEEGVLRIVCARGRAVVQLDVALLADNGPDPPAVADPYAIFYSLHGATPEEGERLTKELATILKANAGVSVPPGMARFAPEPRQLPPI